MKARQKKRRQWRYLASLPGRWTANELVQARARGRAIAARLNIQTAAGVATSPELIRALELGRDHAKWSVDRSIDAIERSMNQVDVDRINAAIEAARGVMVGAPSVPPSEKT